jgi:hypothetical protein
MNGQRLITIPEERDIGVTISNNLKPSAKCTKADRTAKSLLGQIRRAFHFTQTAMCL